VIEERNIQAIRRAVSINEYVIWLAVTVTDPSMKDAHGCDFGGHALFLDGGY
jgi:hypothetical protein